MNLENKKKIVSSWFDFLQTQICTEFEKFEKKFSKKKFISKRWKKGKKKEGGGLSRILKNGKVFDKVGVNKSTVSGVFKEEFRSKILGAEKKGLYWATGISVVAHMKNPKIPAVHFNTRYIITSKDWFGGGIDVTPVFKDKRQKKFIQKKLKELCDNNDKNYKKYKDWCDKYFFLPHRGEPRGIGGIFFDYEMGNWEKNFKFVREVGLSFIEITNKIIESKIDVKWRKSDKEKQLYKRGRYVEFNLLHDRGTKFGLNSGGNTEAILMSLPPIAKWK